jgi:hypothetical protein
MRLQPQPDLYVSKALAKAPFFIAPGPAAHPNSVIPTEDLIQRESALQWSDLLLSKLNANP